MSKNYPQIRGDMRKTLGRMVRHLPEVMKSVGTLHDAAYSDGAMTTKQKELIALGIGICTRCEDCIAFHTYEALAHGATFEEIIECIGVAIQMGGGPAVMYAAHALEALEQFTEDK
ncbi:MAG: carboxymuconolactone decarboxylase family protein [Abditibacteriaceae bacterium]